MSDAHTSAYDYRDRNRRGQVISRALPYEPRMALVRAAETPVPFVPADAPDHVRHAMLMPRTAAVNDAVKRVRAQFPHLFRKDES